MSSWPSPSKSATVTPVAPVPTAGEVQSAADPIDRVRYGGTAVPFVLYTRVKPRVAQGPIETPKQTTALRTWPPARVMRETWEGTSVPPVNTRRAPSGSAVEFGGNTR